MLAYDVVLLVLCLPTSSPFFSRLAAIIVVGLSSAALIPASSMGVLTSTWCRDL
ncbi:hypothetical protein BDZ89DRAFT_1141983 [Hymenopellis radicata]|nr:hypothetical protein BDZ89DRAFT_1141983 [Hymenopellis radicata]